MSSIISVENLVFEYPTKRALHGVSFHVPQGSLTAVVGPNGAGKTTLFQCLAALETPFSGSVTVHGLDTQRHPRECHRHVGYLPDFFGLYDELTVTQCLTFMARSRGVSEAQVASSVASTAIDVGLEDCLLTEAGSLSRGLRQRLAIAQAMVHKPPVLLLDEPAAGLDPESRISLSELLLKLRERGTTIMVSSHILSELEDYSTEMLIMDCGKIVSQREIKESTAHGLRTIEVLLVEEDTGFKQMLDSCSTVVSAEVGQRRARITMAGNEAAQHKLLEAMLTSGLKVYQFSEVRTSMQDLYLSDIKQKREEKL